MVQVQQVITRLRQLGYEAVSEDMEMVQFELDLILDYVVNYCNFTDRNQIPEILDKRIIDRVCSEYLLKKKNSGQLEGFDYDQAIKSIKEGDTQIQYSISNDTATPESRFNDLVNYMQRGFDKWICKWRVLKW